MATRCECCDLENEDSPECADSDVWLFWVRFLTVWLLGIFLMPLWCLILSRCVKHSRDKCYNTCCARCEPEQIDSNATRSRTESSNISTISANIRQPPSRPPSPSAPPSSEIREGIFGRLPRSKASENQCTGRSKYFF